MSFDCNGDSTGHRVCLYAASRQVPLHLNIRRRKFKFPSCRHTIKRSRRPYNALMKRSQHLAGILVTGNTREAIEADRKKRLAHGRLVSRCRAQTGAHHNRNTCPQYIDRLRYTRGGNRATQRIQRARAHFVYFGGRRCAVLLATSRVYTGEEMYTKARCIYLGVLHILKRNRRWHYVISRRYYPRKPIKRRQKCIVAVLVVFVLSLSPTKLITHCEGSAIVSF